MKILLTGGTGLIGKELTKYLSAKGMEVAVLSRNKNLKGKSFHWDPSQNFIDAEALQWADCVIHLAGAGIVDKKWSAERRKVLIDSRVESAQLIYNTLQENSISIKSFISTSGIGYYGAETTEHIYTEQDGSSAHFISDICVKWEEAASNFKKIGIPATIIRTGVVLSKNGGALEKMALPIKMGIGSPLGTGEQYVPWIHIEDLCGIFHTALTNKELENEIYNAVAPESTNNKVLTHSIADALGKKIWAPAVHYFILKIILCKRADLVLKGSRVSSNKIEKTGFNYSYPSLKQALQEIYIS